MPRSRRSPPADPYEPLWARLAERLERETAGHAAERNAAAALADELLDLEPAARRLAARDDTRFRTVALVQELIRRGQAFPALDLLRRFPPGRPPGLIANLQAEALGALAESHLADGRLDAAERALNQAARALDHSPDNEAHARFCQRLAQVRSRQGRFDEAISLCRRAAELACAVGDLVYADGLQIEEERLRKEQGEDTRLQAGLA